MLECRHSRRQVTVCARGKRGVLIMETKQAERLDGAVAVRGRRWSKGNEVCSRRVQVCLRRRRSHGFSAAQPEEPVARRSSLFRLQAADVRPEYEIASVFTRLADNAHIRATPRVPSRQHKRLL